MASDSLDHSGQSKIWRALTHERRMELNTRIRDGQLSPQLLPWLNGLPEVQATCDAHFGGEPISAKNLSDYRRGPYQKWLKQARLMQRAKDRAELALTLARASGSDLSDAAAQLVAGQYLDAFAAADDTADDDDSDETRPDGAPPAQPPRTDAPDPKVALAVVALRTADLKARVVKLKERAADLSEEKFAWFSAGKLLTALRLHLADLREVESSAADDESKMRDITRIVFGDDLLEKIEARRKEAMATP